MSSLLATSACEPFSLLTRLNADAEMQRIFSEDRCVADWVAIEAALAEAQAAVGEIAPAEAAAVVVAADAGAIDRAALWSDAANVGYPILGLVRALAAGIPDGVAERVHYGACLL
jgi:3-carboxy-cis,cis-muconate cycloisomerase